MISRSASRRIRRRTMGEAKFQQVFNVSSRRRRQRREADRFEVVQVAAKIAAIEAAPRAMLRENGKFVAGPRTARTLRERLVDIFRRRPALESATT